MQAAFMMGRYFVARSSAIFRTMAARVVQGVSDQILWASIAASMAIFTSFSETLWKVASTCLWSCGHTTVPMSPVRISLPPMMIGMSRTVFHCRSSSASRAMRSGEPARYGLTGSLAGTGKLRMALFMVISVLCYSDYKYTQKSHYSLTFKTSPASRATVSFQSSV